MSVTVEAFRAAFSEFADVPDAAGRARSEWLTVVESRRINTYVSIGNTSSVVREGVQAAADWCLPHARGNVSKEAGGRLFNARLFHARGERLHLFDAFLCAWGLVKQSRGALLRNDGLSVYGAASEVRFSGFAWNFPRVRGALSCPNEGAVSVRSFPLCGERLSLCMASDCACCGFPPVWGEFFVKVKGVYLKV